LEDKMGSRYFIDVTCPKCRHIEYNVWYAPTCGVTKWKCPECNKVVDLEKYTGITKEEASNADIIKQIYEVHNV